MFYMRVEDELKRPYDMRCFPNMKDGQGISHGISYLHHRTMLKEMGQVMGLDKIVENDR